MSAKKTATKKPAAKAKPVVKKAAKASAKKVVAKKAPAKKVVAKKVAPKKVAKASSSVAKTLKNFVSKVTSALKTKPSAKKATKPAAKPVAKKVAKVAKPVAKKLAAKKPVAKAKPAPKKVAKVAKPAPKKVVAKAPVKKVTTKKAVAGKPTAKAPAKKVAVVVKPVVKAPEKKIEPKPNVAVTEPNNTTVKPIVMKESMTPKEKPEKTSYSDAELEEFRELINKKIAAAREELKYLQEQINRNSSIGDTDADTTFSGLEDGTASVEREYLNQMAARQISYINHLENALVRIQNKTYGICRETGKLIPKERLRAVPHATLSIEAKLAKDH
jgi:RNA polymerase-binding transcription factor DksA